MTQLQKRSKEMKDTLHLSCINSREARALQNLKEVQRHKTSLDSAVKNHLSHLVTNLMLSKARSRVTSKRMQISSLSIVAHRPEIIDSLEDQMIAQTVEIYLTKI